MIGKLGGDMFKNMKIPVENNLDEIVAELERIGYIRKQRFYSGKNIVATDDDGEFYIFSNDLMLEGFRLTTLAELKEM